jgi:hypothetical protein
MGDFGLMEILSAHIGHLGLSTTGKYQTVCLFAINATIRVVAIRRIFSLAAVVTTLMI